MASASNVRSALLFCHPSMENLAEAIAAKCCAANNEPFFPTVTPVSPFSFAESLSANRPMRKFQQVQFVRSIEWKKFKDGWPNLFINNVRECAGRDVIFLGSFHSPEVIFEQLSIIYNMPRYLARSFKFILPYFPTGTMERVDMEGQIATAKVLAMLLSAIPSTARGPAQIVMFDIHALPERFYFSDQVIPRLESAIPLLIKEIMAMPDDIQANLSIAFPDEGAYKRFHPMFEDFPFILCTKIRDGDKRIVSVKEGDTFGRHVIIIDDLIQTGGTLRHCAQVLQHKGALSVNAFVTHAVFPEGSWKLFTEGGPVKFDNFWITDSIPHAVGIARHPPFKLLSLRDAISETLLSYDLKE
ncbi:uncharacterized protein [Diadema setosum]|uniref:uncharacterized protein n=1 Tax=Diadema antillarum TaxID=105358 RepID=UPI003A8A83F8